MFFQYKQDKMAPIPGCRDEQMYSNMRVTYTLGASFKKSFLQGARTNIIVISLENLSSKYVLLQNMSSKYVLLQNMPSKYVLLQNMSTQVSMVSIVIRQPDAVVHIRLGVRPLCGTGGDMVQMTILYFMLYWFIIQSYNHWTIERMSQVNYCTSQYHFLLIKKII